MGSFIGHVIPGSFFFLAGCWWTLSILFRYVKCQTRKREKFRSTPTFSIVQCCGRQLDIECLCAVLATAIGIFVEIFAACIFKHRPVGYGNMQHATMYFFFGLTAFLSVLRPKLQQYFEEYDKALYVMYTSAVVVEGLLFKFHLFNRNDLDVMVHTLLLYELAALAAVTLGEMVYRDSVLLALGRGIFTVLQGTWFWQVAFILYNPLPGAKPWESEDHEQMMLVACYFGWHLGFILVAVMITLAVMNCVIARATEQNLSYIPTHKVKINSADDAQYTALMDDQDEGF